MPYSDLIQSRRAEELFNSGKFDEAYALLSNIEIDKTNSLNKIISSQLLKTEFLFQQGRYQEVLLTAKNIYQNTLELGKNFLRVDALVWMARALIFLNRLEEAYELIIKGKKLLANDSNKSSSGYIKSKAFIAFVKGYFYHVKGEVDRSLVNLNQSLKLRESLGNKHEISESLCWIGIILCKFKGRLTYAKKYAQRSIVLAKESTKKFYIAFGLTSLAAVYSYQGIINRCIPLFEESLAIFKELNNKRMIAITLNNAGEKYRMKGDLDRALDYLEQCLDIMYESENKRDLATVYDFIIQILIEKGNLDQTKIYLHNLKVLRSKLKNLEINQIYSFLKALILKNSLRVRDTAKAENIFNQLLEQKSLSYELTIRILINLCELYLHELKATNNIDVLNDINPLIIKLLDISKKLKSYWSLSETYLLQAKLFLLTFEIKKARKLLNQAQQISERHGLKRLAINISHEHDHLIHQLKTWQELKKTSSSLSERLDLAGLDQQMDFMLKRRAIEVPKLLEEEPVLLLIISVDGNPIYTQSFIKDKVFEEHLFGGFFTAFNSFMNNIFSEGLDRASFGEYTLLMKEVHSFLLCYIYKGQSYSALNRIKALIEQIHQKELNDAFLNSVVNKIFIRKSIPS